MNPVDHSPNALLVESVHRLDRLGMLRAGVGTVSARSGGGLLITPFAATAEPLAVEDLIFIARDGGIKGRGHAAADWSMHQAIYIAHPAVQAIVHIASTHAAALAALERALPAFHHRVAVVGGESVPCVPYQTPGSGQLSDAVIAALADRSACLIAHDGLVASGRSLAQACAIAIEVEALCHSYLAALAVAEPPRLDRSEVGRVLDHMLTYGRATPRG
jgi:L-fuculose-phosphate aldolase